VAWSANVEIMHALAAARYELQNELQAADGAIVARAVAAHASVALQSAVVMQSRSGLMYSVRTIGMTVADVFLQSSVHALLSNPGMHTAFLAHVRLQ
jgi:hypothetical protein